MTDPTAQPDISTPHLPISAHCFCAPSPTPTINLSLLHLPTTTNSKLGKSSRRPRWRSTEARATWTWASTYITIIMPAPSGGLERALHRRNVTWPNMFVSRQESELAINIRKATSIEEVSPKRTYRNSSGTRMKLTIAQGNTCEHASSTHGITRVPRLSGRA